MSAPEDVRHHLDGLDLEEVASLAIELARQAGEYAVRERLTARVEMKGSGNDLVTHVDRAAEAMIVAGVHRRWPDHSIVGEETGEQRGSENRWRWLIDPLDGTHNYVLGLPLYGVCITVCFDDQPVVAVVHDSPHRRTRWAIAGRGAWAADIGSSKPERLYLAEPEQLSRCTVAVAKGYGLPDADPWYSAALAALESATKRVVRHWAPSVDWGVMVEGHLAGFVICSNDGPWDVVGGQLLAVEAGAKVWSSDDGLVQIVGHERVVHALKTLIGFNYSDSESND